MDYSDSFIKRASTCSIQRLEFDLRSEEDLVSECIDPVGREFENVLPEKMGSNTGMGSG